jgi:hypothetical protein
LATSRALVVGLPIGLNAVIMIVLHRSWEHPSRLQAILARASALPVVAGKHERLRAGVVYLGEPAAHLTLAAHSCGGIIQDPDRQHRNRTIDLLFSSVAEHTGQRMIGVLLSAGLDDGLRGLAAIHHAGGMTMVLTPAGPPAERDVGQNAITFDGAIDPIGSQRIRRASLTRRHNPPRHTAATPRGGTRPSLLHSSSSPAVIGPQDRHANSSFCAAESLIPG